MEKETSIVFLKPKRFEDCDDCVRYVAEDRIVNVNLKDLKERDARRLYDYVHGAVYVKQAKLIDIGDNIFCCVPKNVGYELKFNQESAAKSNEEEEIIPFSK
ncbi:MAG: cell division protein SepF [Fusobacterium necrophorum]|nr:cell division protein SepF [Fusobacterium necrophorum]